MQGKHEEMRWCECKGCQEEREAFMKQLSSPFYKEVEAYRGAIRKDQFLKAAKKYKEPFNPDSWTGQELADHAMQENFDQSVYITGLRDRVIKQEQEIDKLKTRCADYEKKLNQAHEEVLRLEELLQNTGKGIFIDERV